MDTHARPWGSRPILSTGLVGLGLAVLLAAVYGQVGWHQLVNFDDPAYLYENSQVRAGLTAGGWHWAWVNKEVGMWHPLTWLVHMLVSDIGQGRPGAHLLANLGCHWTNALLLFLLLRRATGAGGRSVAVALLFALHPVNVETVAWASQLKSTLSTVFLLGTLLAYTAYARSGDGRAYGLALLSAVFGLLAKPMLVSLPLLLLLWDFWPLGRIRGIAAPGEGVSWRRLLEEKVPFVLLALAGVILTLLPWGPQGAVNPVSSISAHGFPWERMLTAPINYLRYLAMFFRPVDLAVYYPHLSAGGAGRVGGAILLLAVISLLAWRNRRACPALFFGWGWFLVATLPVSGVLVIGPHDWADRYLYVPEMGLLVAVVWLVDEFAGAPARRWPAVLLGATAALFAWLTFVQAGYWRDSLTLWRHAAAVTAPTALGHINLGNALLDAGRSTEAKAEFAAAIVLVDNDPRPYVNLAIIARQRGDPARAVDLLRHALVLAPKDARIYSNLGSLLDDLGEKAEAQTLLEKAVQLRPDLAEARVNLGVLLAQAGDLDGALANFETAARLKPGDPAVTRNLQLVRQQIAARAAGTAR
jgi:Flp pilus assembly protein TadD